MFGLMSWLGMKSSIRDRKRNKAAQRTRLEIESLEQRQVMSVTFQGGAVLANVEVQALYLGRDWSTNAGYHNQTGYLDGFLNWTVHSSYMDMLGNAGYGVGRGSFNAGKIGLVNIDKTTSLDDSQIQTYVQNYISDGTLQAPDSNRLYIVFVEDNVVVTQGGANSQNDFLGYHGAFAGNDASGASADIRYAVIPYPGGTVGNATNSWLTTLQGMTEVTSHELAEGVTDPDVNYNTLGWYDDANGEVGDIVNGSTVFLHGYAVQRISDQNDQAMTPAGATALAPVSFVLKTNGSLWEHNKTRWTLVSSNVASVSDQGIDNQGRTMVDLVTKGGAAYEFHDGSGLTFLKGGVKSAVAGQGVSYVLLTDGTLDEYQDANGWSTLDNGIIAISAGTDAQGVNAVDVIYSGGDAYEISDSSGWNYIASGVRSISAGQQGIDAYVTTSGDAYWYDDSTGNATLLGSNVAQATAGTDQFGNYLIDVLFSGGSLQEYHSNGGWTTLGSGVQSISKGRAGLVDVVFANGNAYEHTASGTLVFLTAGARVSV